VAGVFAFATLELVVSGHDKPENLAIATLIYSALTFIAMALYGVETWTARGEAFSVYFNLFSRLSVFETRDGVVGLRQPLSGLTTFKPDPGTAVLPVMIGSVTFDGAAGAPSGPASPPTCRTSSKTSAVRPSARWSSPSSSG
jgi:hypothetical protein